MTEEMTEEMTSERLGAVKLDRRAAVSLGNGALPRFPSPRAIEARFHKIDDLEQTVITSENYKARNNESQIKLPKIDLPTFSGAYEDWHSCFNTFDSLRHSNTSLSDIQRFHYLKSPIKGEAAETIASIEISQVHYNDAWSRLTKRYDNKRVAVQNHIKAIFDLPNVRKENCIKKHIRWRFKTYTSASGSKAFHDTLGRLINV